MIELPLSAKHVREVVAGEGYEIELVRHGLGPLALGSDAVVLCDPLNEPEAEALAGAVPGGQAQVSVVMAHLREERRPALLCLEFGEQPPVAWEPVRLADEPEVDEGAEVNGPAVRVESGYLAVMDGAAAERLLAALQSEDPTVEDELASSLSGWSRRTFRGRGFAAGVVELVPGAEAVLMDGVEGGLSAYWGGPRGGGRTHLVVDLGALALEFTRWGVRLG